MLTMRLILMIRAQITDIYVIKNNFKKLITLQRKKYFFRSSLTSQHLTSETFNKYLVST